MTERSVKTITKEEIAAFDTEEFNGRIFVIDTPDKTNQAVNYLSGFDNLGFDTETRPSFKKGNLNNVALIQLATDNRCYLFRLNRIGFSTSLIQLLSDANISKIGLSLKDDFTSMSRRMQFTPQGFIDIQKLVSEHDIADLSLQKIYAILFQKKISKSQRLSNWEAEELSEAQKKYAALDAWACLRIYEKLCHTNTFT
ncbi:MAG: 3'-5' exonuclease domain-containing protein 2 [Candidatus Azobacteroides sp.]|nr:3'-5' exonuclease domain-containing protein 2 [Candidatus Azobacteroides sp.]